MMALLTENVLLAARLCFLTANYWRCISFKYWSFEADIVTNQYLPKSCTWKRIFRTHSKHIQLWTQYDLRSCKITSLWRMLQADYFDNRVCFHKLPQEQECWSRIFCGLLYFVAGGIRSQTLILYELYCNTYEFVSRRYLHSFPCLSISIPPACF